LNSNSQNTDLSQTILQLVNERKPQTVTQLITFAKEELPNPEKEILETVLNLQNQGRIKFESQPLSPSTKLATFIKTSHALWYWVTIAAAITTAVLVFTVPENLYPLSIFRIALGTVFILWLPGYSFAKALFPQQMPIRDGARNLDSIERIALSLGMSLALVPIVGLVLNFTPWGIRLAPIVLSLLALTLVFATVAVTREFKLRTNKENPKT
jgi:hypothetical protein